MMTAFQRDMLLEIAAECEARAEKAAAEMLGHKRSMQLLRQRALDFLERRRPLLPIACVLQRVHEVVQSLVVAGTHAQSLVIPAWRLTREVERREDN